MLLIKATGAYSVDMPFGKKLGEQDLSGRDSIHADKHPNMSKPVAAFVTTLR